MNGDTLANGIQDLKKVVTNIYPLANEAWDDFASIWKVETAKRKSVLTAIGQKEGYLYFILDGAQRIYYYDDQDREATIIFTYQHSFGGVLDSFLLQSPSRYCYETLTGSTFMMASFREVHTLMKKHHTIEAFINKALSFTLAGLLERLVELQCFSSEEKFRRLLQRSPHILQTVPHKYLANYLGIDPTNFSKLMNTVRI